MNTIITIGRQYGSGGKAMGKLLAKKLGVEYYDDELVAMAAEKNNMHKDVLKSVDEKATKSFLFSLVTGGDFHYMQSPMYYDMPINDKLFIAQSDIIKELAEKHSCVIVGRCADYVLRDSKQKCINIFAYADKEKRIARISELYELTPEKAKERINKKEKIRKTYYNYYTNKEWGNIENYDLCIDIGFLGIEKTADYLYDLITKYTED